MKKGKLKLNRKNTSESKIYFSDILLTVAIVLGNDQDILKERLKDLHEILCRHFKYFEILAIDNGSSDDSRRQLFQMQKNLANIRTLILSKECSLDTGIKAALENSIGDYVVIFDLRRDPVSLIIQLVKTAQKHGDVVIADCVNESRLSKILCPSYSRLINRPAVIAVTKSGNKHNLKFYKCLPGFIQTHLYYKRKQSKLVRARGFTLGFEEASSNLFRRLSGLSIAVYLGIAALVLNISILTLAVIRLLIFGNVGQNLFNLSVINAIMFSIIISMLVAIARSIDSKGAGKTSQYHITEEITSSVIAETDRVNVV